MKNTIEAALISALSEGISFLFFSNTNYYRLIITFASIMIIKFLIIKYNNKTTNIK